MAELGVRGWGVEYHKQLLWWRERQDLGTTGTGGWARGGRDHRGRGLWNFPKGCVRGASGPG